MAGTESASILQRFQGLQFAAELSTGDPSQRNISHCLWLRFLGLLEAQCQVAKNRPYLARLINHCHQQLDATSRAHGADKEVRERARCLDGFRLPCASAAASTDFPKVWRMLIEEAKCLEKQLEPPHVPKKDGQDDRHPVPKHPLMGDKSLTKDGMVGKYSSYLTQEELRREASRVQLPRPRTSEATAGMRSNDAEFGPSKSWSSQSLVAAYAPRDSNADKHPRKRDYGAFTGSRPSRQPRCPEPAHSGPSSDEEADDIDVSDFMTAKDRLVNDPRHSHLRGSMQGAAPSTFRPSVSTSVPGPGSGKTLGGRRSVRSGFVPPQKFHAPLKIAGSGGGGQVAAPRMGRSVVGREGDDPTIAKLLESFANADGELPDILKNVEPRLLELISNEVIDKDPNVRWDDIAGLDYAKGTIKEMVIWPMQRPDLFTGCRAPGRGLLLFGPPGTGKTMIGKAIAGEVKATFFNISASSLTSKWIGEGEKMVRALFAVATCRAPAVIFIDEIDSLLSQRKSDGEHESSRRLKTEFLVQMDGCGNVEGQVLLIGATNRPQELDEAARRRLSKRLYIPLPNKDARSWIVTHVLRKDNLLTLSPDDVDTVCKETDGYSGSDMKNLVKEASMGPLREAMASITDIDGLNQDALRPINLQDFRDALQHVRTSVSTSELGSYEDWNKQFGTFKH